MMVDLLQRPIPRPQLKVAVHRALRRKVLRQVPPLAAGFQHVQQTVDHLPEVHRAPAPTPLARRDERPDQRPLRIRQITRVTQAVPPIPLPTLRCPQGAPPLSKYSLESQPIHPTQQVCVRALRDQPCLRDSKNSITKLLHQYEKFLETTNADEQELFKRFSDKEKSAHYMREAYTFGDLAFDVLSVIGKGDRFFRLLVV